MSLDGAFSLVYSNLTIKRILDDLRARSRLRDSERFEAIP